MLVSHLTWYMTWCMLLCHSGRPGDERRVGREALLHVQGSDEGPRQEEQADEGPCRREKLVPPPPTHPVHVTSCRGDLPPYPTDGVTGGCHGSLVLS